MNKDGLSVPYFSGVDKPLALSKMRRAFRLFRNKNRRENVGYEKRKDAGSHEQQYEDYADYHWVKIKVLGNAAAHAGYKPVLTGAVKFFSHIRNR